MKINENSTKSFFIEIYCNDIKISTATGFEVQYKNKYLITNWHVVSGRNFITKECINSECAIPNKLVITYKKYLSDDKFEWTKNEINLLDEEEKKLWYEHPIYGNDIDVVAIPLETHSATQHHKEAYSLNSNYELSVTEPVFVLGFPLGYIVNSKDEPHAIWTSGTVASDPDLDVMIKDTKLPAFLIDSKTRQGQSGSPVIYYSESGFDPHYNNGQKIVKAIWGEPFMKEVGIYSGRINKNCDLGYVWKWKVIKEILESIKTD